MENKQYVVVLTNEDKPHAPRIMFVRADSEDDAVALAITQSSFSEQEVNSILGYDYFENDEEDENEEDGSLDGLGYIVREITPESFNP